MGVLEAFLFSIPAGGTTAFILREHTGIARTFIACVAGLVVGLTACVAVALVVTHRVDASVASIAGTVLGVMGAAGAANRPLRPKRKSGDLRDS